MPENSAHQPISMANRRGGAASGKFRVTSGHFKFRTGNVFPRVVEEPPKRPPEDEAPRPPLRRRALDLLGAALFILFCRILNPWKYAEDCINLRATK
eukprot:1970187-Pyramimonas_sp.AAC.1